ncbi:restriction endonuclease S subunit [Pseudomonas sp. GM25]|nr:restriction endonuclease S subunit [Pseudomonas sp. GM25]
MKCDYVSVRLSQVAEINPKPAYKLKCNEVVSFLSMSAVTVEGVTSEGEDKLYSDVNKGYTSFKNGDVLIAKITPCFENGKIAQAKIKNEYGFGSTEFHVVRAIPGLLDARYLLHFLRQSNVRLDGEHRMIGSAGHRRVPADFFSDLKVLLPPLFEQRRIAGILDKVESVKQNSDLLIKMLQVLPQSVFVKVFGNLTEKESSLPTVPLRDLVDPLRPISYGILMPGPEQEEGVKYVRVVDMKDGGIDVGSVRMTTVTISAAYKRSLLKQFDLIMSIRGHVGRLAIVPSELEGANITQDTARIAVDESRILPVFLLEYLRTEGVQRWLTRHVKGVAVRGINLSDVKNIPVILPNLDLQRDFALKVKAIGCLISSYRTQLESIEALFASLQHRAFRGEL